jgi:hypothetical protein
METIEQRMNEQAAQLVARGYGETLIGLVKCFKGCYYPGKPDKKLFNYNDGYAIRRNLHDDMIIWQVVELTTDGHDVEILEFVTTRDNC